jgi:hypothetical protein
MYFGWWESWFCVLGGAEAGVIVRCGLPWGCSAFF